LDLRPDYIRRAAEAKASNEANDVVLDGGHFSVDGGDTWLRVDPAIRAAAIKEKQAYATATQRGGASAQPSTRAPRPHSARAARAPAIASERSHMPSSTARSHMPSSQELRIRDIERALDKRDHIAKASPPAERTAQRARGPAGPGGGTPAGQIEPGGYITKAQRALLGKTVTPDAARVVPGAQRIGVQRGAGVNGLMKGGTDTQISSSSYAGESHRASVNQRTFNTEALMSKPGQPARGKNNKNGNNFVIEKYMPEWKTNKMQTQKMKSRVFCW